MPFNILYYPDLKNYKIHNLKMQIEDKIVKGPERVSKFKAQIQIFGGLTEEELTRLYRSVKGCKIHNTLSAIPEIEVSLSKLI